MEISGKHYRTVWMEGDIVRMINQPLIPHKFEIVDLKNLKETAKSISTMIVRGAGAIGATGGYGMAQAALQAPEKDFKVYIDKAAEVLSKTRPTAQNLFYAIERVKKVTEAASNTASARKAAVAEAQKIADEDAAACEAIGEHGSNLIKDGFKINTHCNAGWLAFVDWGSALSPIYKAKRQGKKVFVWVDETRPRCQGARLTAYELGQEGIPHKIIADNTTGYLMQTGEIDMVIVGTDRVAANGDVANKIGTYSSAVCAKENNIPFYVSLPTSTIDRNCPSGDKIPIEVRDEDEVLYAYGRLDDGTFTKVRLAPKESHGHNIAFDVTPAKYITGLITEKGIVKASAEGIRSLFE